MGRVMALPLVCIFFLMTGCGSRKEDTSAEPSAPTRVRVDPNSLAGRFTAAEALADRAARDEALGEVADAAARKGDVDTVVRTLWAMTDVELKDQTAFQSAVSLAKLGRHDGALDVAKSIADRSLRYEARLAISK